MAASLTPHAVDAARGVRLPRALALGMVGAVTLLPVVASPLLVTADGPSHAYNAMLRVAIRAHQAPFAIFFMEAPGGLRPNQATEFLLATLGARLGWEAAERCVLTLAMLACLGFVGLLLGRTSLAMAVLAAWLAHSWFAWMGFYDFVLSVGFYAALVATVTRPPSRARSLLLQGVFLAMYVTHFFTFVVGLGVALVVLGRHAARREAGAGWSQLALLLPATLLAVIGATSGGVGGAPMWGSPWRAIMGLALGDIVRSFHPLDAVGGVAIMGATWAAVWLYLRQARRADPEPPDALVLFGVSLLVVSVVAPASLGAGGYVPIRLQLLGVITLFPVIAVALRGTDVRWVRAATLAVFLGFVAHTTYIVRVSRAVNADLETLERLLGGAGATEGAWVRTRFVDAQRGLFRITGYRHLVERIAERRQLIVLDNYEALYGIFAVSWRERPDWLGIRRYQDTVFALELARGTVGWGTALYFVHEGRSRVVTGDPSLELGPTIQAGAFAVTTVRRRA